MFWLGGRAVSLREGAMSERRAVARKKTLLQGRLFFNNGCNSVDCTVRDISDAGARLSFGGAVTIPEVVELRIPNKAEQYRAVVQWRIDKEVGVAFGVEDPPSSTAGPGDVVARIARLERTVALLLRKINELQTDQRQRHGEEM
jgi:hypothetical protein